MPEYLKPTQKVRWPNVTLSSMARFEQSLDGWFKRKNIRIWITEYGHEVKQDGEPKGVTRAQQAAYAGQALSLAKADPRVDMFIWFVFRDHETSEWQSGLRTRSGAAKPSLAQFRPPPSRSTRATRSSACAGGRPTVSVPLRAYAAGTSAARRSASTSAILDKGKLVAGASRRCSAGRHGAVHAHRLQPVKEDLHRHGRRQRHGGASCSTARSR